MVRIEKVKSYYYYYYYYYFKPMQMQRRLSWLTVGKQPHILSVAILQF